MEPVPFDKRTGKIWFNGQSVSWSDVKIHVLSHGLHYASCVFEGERVYDGSIFKLEEHTSRFFYSANRMGIKIPFSEFGTTIKPTGGVGDEADFAVQQNYYKHPSLLGPGRTNETFSPLK